MRKPHVVVPRDLLHEALHDRRLHCPVNPCNHRAEECHLNRIRSRDRLIHGDSDHNADPIHQVAGQVHELRAQDAPEDQVHEIPTRHDQRHGGS